MKTAFAFLFVLGVITEGRSAKKLRSKLFKHKVHQQSEEVENLASVVFPVEVDLSKFYKRITARLDEIDNSITNQGLRIDGVDGRVDGVSQNLSIFVHNLGNLNSQVQYVAGQVRDVSHNVSNVEGRVDGVASSVSSVKSEVDELRESLASAIEGRVVCQTGTAGCTSCGGEDPDDTYTSTKVTRDVTFGQSFSSTPTVTLGLKGIYMHDPNNQEADNYGWDLYPDSVTTSGFVAYFDLQDYDISTLSASWVACGHME